MATNLTTLVAFLPGGLACLARLRKLIARHPTPRLSLLQAADLFERGQIELAGGQFGAAYASFGELHALLEQIGTLSQIHVEIGLWYAHAAALCGEFDVANEQQRRLAALMDQPALAIFRRQTNTFFIAARCLVDWGQGSAEGVRAGLAAAEAQTNSTEWPIASRLRNLIRCLALLTLRDWAAAEPALVAAYAEQGSEHETAFFGDAGLLLAHLYLQTGRQADALAVLGPVLARYQRIGTPGIALLIGAPAIIPLLQLAVAHDVQPSIAAGMLDMLPRHPGPVSQATPAVASRSLPAVDQLTAREHEVLHLIAGGLSNAEIAERLVVSPATVKKHINNIFAKLDARSRTQALVHAREHGLI